MRSRALFMVGFTLVVTAAGWWQLAHHGSSPAGRSLPSRYCQDVQELTQTLVDIRAGMSGQPQQAGRLGKLGAAFSRDGAAFRASNRLGDAAAADAMANDLSEWQAAATSGDAVEADIAINRTLSNVSALPPC